VTDADGNYALQISDTDLTLVVSYIGFVNQEVRVGSQNTLDVVLVELTELLDEVVVIAYGETERRKFTGSLTNITADDLSQVPQVSPIQMIQGKAAGVLVEDVNGQPGSTGNIVIRGIGTLGDASDPLYVVDGTPTTSLASLNPNDIASISILKDAIATSIYGSRAANGVVLITTKKGKIGKTQFSANVSLGTSGIENPNDFQMMNSSEYVEYYREAYIAMGKNPDDPTSGSYLPLSAASVNTDWLDEISRVGTMFQFDLSASGGTDRTRHFASISHYSQEGAVLGTKFDRTTGRLNFGMSPVDKINVDLNLLGSYTNTDLQYSNDGRGGTFSGAFNVAPVSTVLATETTPPHLNGLGYNFSLPSNAGHNPVATANLRERTLSGLRVFPSLRISYQPIDKLVLSTSGSIDYTFNEEDAYQSKFYFAENDNGYAEYESMVFTDANFNFTAAYNHDINTNHQISPLIGVELYESTTTIQGVASRDFAFDGINNVAAGAVPLGSSYSYNANTLVSLFARLNYAFHNKLFIEGSFRRDGSSRFGPNNRWGNFYAVGVGYNLMEESFMQSQSLFSGLRVRASYGIQGNNAIGDFAWRSGYGPGGTYIVPPKGGGSGVANSGAQPDEPGNPELKWEQSKSFNFGIDFGILDNRVGGTIEYYNRTSVDLLAERLISHTSGFTSIIDNIGDVKNSGIEISLNSSNVQSGDFKWSTDFNITLNTNEIIELNGVSDTLFADARLARIVGQPVDQWYLPQYAGVDPATGLPLYVTSEGGTSSNINNAAPGVIGNSSLTPDFFGSLTNTLSYKGLSLSFMFYMKQGFEVYRSHLSDLSVPSSNNQPASNLARWQAAGDQTDVPRADDVSAQLNSSRWLEDGSFIRLKNLMLAYRLPASASDKIGLSGLTFSLRGVNVLTFTDYNGFNPDVGYYEDDDYPIARTITFGISAQF
jgi:TonB-linked SusC/RagA family outer membrane protein